jgi:hypothetical protein
MRTPRTAAGSAASAGAATGAAANGSAAPPGPGHADGKDAAQHAGDPAAGSGGAARDPGNARIPLQQPPARSPLAFLRLHWVAALLLAAGLGLRVLVQFSYSPALLYIDSVKYLYGAWPGADPLGYDVPLKLILLVGNLSAVEVVQHLLGLAMAVTLYLLLRRRGVPRWLAALAMGPVLLDAYQLEMEATIMPDVWFEALIVAGLAILLWRPRTTVRLCVLAGVVLGLSATVRQVGEVLVVPALIFVLAGAGGWRQAITKSAAMIIAFAVPIVAYCSASYALTGNFWLSRNGDQATYGRMAALADCATLKLPSYEKPLCPTPRQQANGPDWLDHGINSPLRKYVQPADLVRSQVISDFNRRVETQQPLRVLGRISSDAAKLFAVARSTSPGDTPISRWQFHATYPHYLPTVYTDRQGTIIFALKLAVAGGPTIYRKLDTSLGGNSHVRTPGTQFLRRYQLYGGYAPGPLMLLAVLAGLAGSLTIFRRRASFAQRQLALGALLVFSAGVAVLIISDLFEFSWRYQLPALVTLPAAGAFGIEAALRFARRRKTSRIADSARQEQRVTARAG